ncbi:MAG: MAC/perforin domain-containing protein [Methylococcaceae bacterium]|nr:MAC/perforin domain-containing protein [Methylococcaceae bacterium]
MADIASELPVIPGLDMVGRGIYLRPQQPFELKGILFHQDNHQIYPSKETGQSYRVPEGYEINDSPPMPAAQALNQMVIEESWERFEKQTSLDIAAAASNAPFSVDVNASQAGQLRSEEEAYYALRNSFIPLWAVYIPDKRRFVDGDFDLDIPTPYDPAQRRAYERFFDRFGTHYIKRVWVGGKAMLAFTIAKSSEMSKEDIKAGIKASMTGLGSASTNASSQSAKERLQSNSECTVFGKGGDELKLATLSSLDEACYNEWLATIKDNPQVIEFDACGIWTLVDDDEKSKALRQAYIEATVFTPLRVVFNLDQRVHVFRGKNCFSYDPDTGETTPSSPIREKWPMLAEVGFEQVDAAFLGKYLVSSTGEDLSRKLYFFNRGQYIRVDVDTRLIDPGYPRTIAEGWPGVGFERIDTALNVSPEAVYFFLGGQYIRFNMLKNKAEDGYPEATAKRWAGLVFDRIDASVYWGNAKVFFFRGNQHIRYDMVTCRADPGYPKFIFGNYVEDWKFFD